MRKFFIITFFTFLLPLVAFSQGELPTPNGLVKINATKTELKVPFAGKANLADDSKFFAKPIKLSQQSPDENLTQEEIDQYLETNKTIFIDDNRKFKVNNDDIAVGRSYRSNQFNNGTPMDNSVAISDGGIIVSAVNTNFSVFDSTGKLKQSRTFNASFFGDFSLQSTIFDPRVVYDSESDRFIMCIMHGTQPSESKLMVLFSETNDPTDGWNIYQLSGNPLNNGTWFDYPHIAVSNDEVFITGNLFTPGPNNTNISNQTVIYQINKHDGYNNEADLTLQVWSNIQSADNSAGFSLVPVGYGFDGTQGPGMYFIATRSNNGGSLIDLYYINNTIDATDEQLSTQKITVDTYLRPNLARQKDVVHQLKTGDSRMQSAFILGNIIHYTFCERGSSNKSSLRYGRLDVTDLSVKENTFGSSTTYYAFPSVASFTDIESEQSAILAFEASSSDIYPEIRIVAIDNDMNFTNSFLVKEGESPVTIFNSGQQRWGDYTGIARRHNADQPEVWVCAAYGWGANIWANYNAKITTSSDSSLIVNPPTPSDSVEKTYPVLYPNPNNGLSNLTTIELDITEEATYTLDLYDASGKFIRTIIKERLTPQHTKLIFDHTEFPSGSYVLVLKSDKGYYKTFKAFIMND